MAAGAPMVMMPAPCRATAMMPTGMDADSYANVADMGTGPNAAIAGMDANPCVGAANMGAGIDADIPSIGRGCAQQGNCKNRSE